MGEERIAARFARCRDEERAALVGYLTAGDPDPAASERLLLALAAEVDILEIGLPFSDPMADGPVIQAAAERALAAGTRLADAARITAAVRAAHPALPIVWMGYGNTPLAHGAGRFAATAAEAGVDGVLLVDVPPEEELFDGALRSAGLRRILLLTPTSTPERVRRIAGKAEGFVYYVSLTGTTGAELNGVAGVAERVRALRREIPLPVCVGFGVKRADQVAAIAGFADGVVVGSRFVAVASEQGGEPGRREERLRAEAAEMRRATRRGGV